jgi:hypothetical protein
MQQDGKTPRPRHLNGTTTQKHHFLAGTAESRRRFIWNGTITTGEIQTWMAT